MKSYHLDTTDLNAFSRAHMSYINQIFGDQTVREIIQEIWKKPGKLDFEISGEEFTNSFHHFYRTSTGKKVCSVDNDYQNIEIDINDSLCQSYSLMVYLKIPFDKTPSHKATPEMKYQKQMSMINMYRSLLINPTFINKFSNEIIFRANNKLWTDTTNPQSEFYIIEKYKKAGPIVANINVVLDAWASYGWQHFVGNG